MTQDYETPPLPFTGDPDRTSGTPVSTASQDLAAQRTRICWPAAVAAQMRVIQVRMQDSVRGIEP